MVARVSKSWELKTYAVKPPPMAFPRESRLRNRTTTTLWCALREGSDVGESPISCLRDFLLMLQPLVDQMAIPCFPSHARVVAIALCLLLLFSCWSCCRNHLASTFLATLFVLALSTSLPFSLPRIRQLVKSDSIQKPSPADQDFADKKVDAAVGGSGEGELTHTWTSSDSGTPESLSRSASQFSNFDDDDDESLPEDACHSTESSEDSISDDENLIEISLPDGHFVAPEKSKALMKPLPDTRRGFLTNLLPDSVLRQHGLMELLSEINEEDNLIEIDITRGSIKCSREGIKA
ncbi:unnamed protein product [Musa hybrid cultivar]